MRKLIVIFLISILSLCLWADNKKEALKNSLRERVEVTVSKKTDIRKLIAAKFAIDRCCLLQNNKVQVYATPFEIEKMKKMGFTTKPNPVRIGKNTKMASYHTYETLTKKLTDLTNRYSDIAALHTLGKSVEGRELWVVKISDNVEQEEAEAELKYISSMHGDEVVGKEMMVYLIEHMLQNYQKDSAITDLINKTQIWIMPSMNPDGTAHERRYNANWVDLNRDFPDVVDDPKSDPKGRAIEVQHLMNFTAKHNFALSINFHGGAVVVNYPWDTKPGNPPYVRLVKALSLGYSTRNKPMYNNPSFPQGITNGYDWYEVNNGMQDWNYHWHNALELTLELSNIKWPNASTLAGYWDDNRASLLWYISQIHKGVHGSVRDQNTGKPVVATVAVTGINKNIKTGALHGDYYRVLLPGTYTLRFSAPGYHSKTITSVEVKDRELTPTILDVELTRE